jgi:group I intron endonuclease
MVGIYKITNLVNGKTYIGQSFDINKRWVMHKSAAFNENNPGYNYPLYRAMRKYGYENFLFEILEECLIDELNDKEIFYIEKFNSRVPNGYNQDGGGNSAPHYTKLSEDLVTQIIERLKTSKENSDTIGREFGVCGSTIRKINVGAHSYRENETYPIRDPIYVVDKESSFCENCGAGISADAKRHCPRCSQIAQRRIERPSPLELAKMIKENGFAQTGKYFGVSDNTIKKWCKFYQIPHKIKDLIAWYNTQMGIVEVPEQIKEKVDPKKAVEQIDPSTNKVVAVFESTNAAARHLGKKKGNHISEVCNGINETAHGYKWRYIA